MPEGPEVATVRDELHTTIIDKTITKYHLTVHAKITGLDKLILPVKIVNVLTYGKKLLIYCENVILVASLGMTGMFVYQPETHTHIIFDLNDGVEQLCFKDTRRFGNIQITDNLQPMLDKLGPDLLAHAMNQNTWISNDKWMSLFDIPKVKRWNVSKMLLDQSLVAGIGNYLCVEILYYSGINPTRIVGTLTEEEWERMRISAHSIILLSYSYGGFTLNSYIAPSGKPGRYPAAVYGKSKDSYGNNVHKTSINKRPAYIVDKFQR